MVIIIEYKSLIIDKKFTMARRGLTEEQVQAMIFADSDDEEDDLHELLGTISDSDSDSDDDQPPPKPRFYISG